MSTVKQLNIGIEDSKRKEIVEGLTRLLADTYALRLKTQNFHWNVRGQMYFSLHEAFEEQYNDLAVAVDEIAERIRKLGAYTPGNLELYSELSNIEGVKRSLAAQDMVSHLIKDNEGMAKRMRDFCDLLDDAGDEATLDLLAGRIDMHEEVAWTMRATLG